MKEDAVAAIVGDMLGLTPPPQIFSQFLARQSEGNPFFVAEYLRTAVAESLLWRDTQGRWRIAEDEDTEATAELYENLPLPGSLRDLVGRRLQGLPTMARKVAGAAAVLGREVDLALMRQLGGLDERDLLEATSELLRRQVLEEVDAARLRFVHDKIREVAYGSLGSGERRRLHGLAARALREVYGEAGAPAAAIARHYDAAGELTEARSAYERAAEDAGQRFANEEALRLYRRAEELWQDDPLPEAHRVCATLALGQAKVRRRLGRYAEAALDLRRAEQNAEAFGDRRQQAMTLIERAEIAWRTSLPQETEQLADAAEALARQLGDLSLQAAAARHRAIAWFYLGRKSESIVEMGRARALARDGGDEVLELQLAENLASLLHLARRPSLAIPLLENLLPRYRASGSRERLCSALIPLGQSRTAQGRFVDALKCLSEGLEEARAMGSPDAEMRAIGSLASCYDDLYLVYRALQAANRAARLAQDLGDLMSEAVALRMGCRQLRMLKDWPAAHALLTQAMMAAEAAKAPFLLAFLTAEMARLAAAEDQKNEVVRLADAALGRLRPEDEIGRGRGYGVRMDLAGAALRVKAWDLLDRLLETMRGQIVTQAEEGPEDIGWMGIVLPALLSEVHRAGGRPLGAGARQRLGPDALPSAAWATSDWVEWGRRELASLLEPLPADLKTSFLAHPDHRLGILVGKDPAEFD